MNFIAQVEEHLRDLGAEARKKHPGVKEASERAILQLRSLQNAYVTAVRKATQTGGTHPTTALFRSQDILRPFLLAANYPNASSTLLQISLDAMSLLMEGNAICDGDGIHMVRVWIIQANVCASSLKRSTLHHGGGTKTASPTTSSSSSWFGGMLSSNTDVSSSSGQGGAPSKIKESEKVALELLSCLLQLLELKDLSITEEQWASSIQLCCILLDVEKSTTVQQAANSTLHQVLSLLFEHECDYAIQTWNDLMILAANDTNERSLMGAFSHCTGSGPAPPPPHACLELLHNLLSQQRPVDDWLSCSQHLMESTLELTESQLSLQEQELERLWRSFQLARVLLMKQQNEQSDLISFLIKDIVAATEACRKNHDFEDGYVYYPASVEQQHKQQKSVTTTLIPNDALWKAGLALETLLVVDEWSCQESFSVVAEAISDFLTICASCQQHMLQLVECASFHQQQAPTDPDNAILFEPQVFRHAEEVVHSSSKQTQCNMGDALWIALHIILKMITSVGVDCFAPCLAVLQHYLKRFPGCNVIVTCTLEGYLSLADFAISPSRALLRQALLSSLCKLSLPSWGKHDSKSLDEHHVETLICLLKIVHKHYDSIGQDWRMVLWTFQELSILSISSPLLIANEAYAKALAVSCTFARIAPLSTCLSDESLICKIDSLAEISISLLETRDVWTDGDAMSRSVEITKPRSNSVDASAKAAERRTSNSSKSMDAGDPRSSIGGKLMSFAGRTLLGSHAEETADEDNVVGTVTERTKNTYFGSYQQDFVRRMVSSKRALRSDVIGKLPFCLVALTDVALANTYRFSSCGKTISNHFCALAAASPDIRVYAMDILAMLVASQLSGDSPIPSSFSGPGRISIERPMRNQFLVVEAVEMDVSALDQEGVDSVSQADLLAPLCENIQMTENSEMAEAGMTALHSMLEGAGHNMTDGDAWTVMIAAVSSLSGDANRSGSEWATSCTLAFRCLKLLVDDFLDQLPPMTNSSESPRVALLDCCSSFGSSRHDVNISLTAIGLLWTIADQESTSWSIDRALSKLVVLSSDSRTEVRNCAVNTLFSCIVGRGQSFTGEQWEVCICQTIFGVYDRVVSRDDNGSSGAAPNGDSEQVRGGKKSKAASDRYKVSVHHSRDSAGKQWTTTEVMVLQGLSRVLRNFFPQLLDTMDSSDYVDGDKSHNPVWFKTVWPRILDMALNAATQSDCRETLDLRTAGVDLLVLCCQLTCQAGVEASITPARVGTNMEVVNGALRHVNETPKTTGKETPPVTSSVEVDQWREQFFLAAFDAVDAYHDDIERESRSDLDGDGSSSGGSTKVQVLQKLALGLGKLYECCKNEEFDPERRRQSPVDFHLELVGENDCDRDDLEGRFVEMVATIVRTATGDAGARFLTQAQRTALELLRTMSSLGSDAAIRALSSMGGHSFFWTMKNSEGDERADDETTSSAAVGSELLSREAAKAVTDEISTGDISNETKVEVLYRVLSVFVEATDAESRNGQPGKKKTRYKRCYTLFVPIVESGLKSAAKLGEMSNLRTGRKGNDILAVEDKISDAEAEGDEGGDAEAPEIEWILRLWEKVVVILTEMLSPIQSASNGPYISRASNVLDILNAVVLHVPSTQSESVCMVLSSGVSSSLEVARFQTVTASDDSKTTEARRRAKARRDEALKIFEACFSGLCSLQPESQRLHDLAKRALQDALPQESAAEVRPEENELRADVAVLVCESIATNAEMERLVIKAFSLLCKLMMSDDEVTRRAAGSLLERVDVAGALEDATRRCEMAEERAQEAEEQIQELIEENEDLRDENESLQQQILVYSASSAIT